MNISKNQPHYLIIPVKNKVIRLIKLGIQSSTKVVLCIKLGDNKVISDAFISLPDGYGSTTIRYYRCTPTEYSERTHIF